MATALRLARGALDGALRAGSVLSVLLLVLLAIGPRTGLYRPVTVLSDSMEPTFSRGDLLIARPIPHEELQVGQVVSYHIPVGDHRVESHRIVEILSAGSAPIVRTKGDASSGPDPWNAQLAGDRAWVVAGTVPELGHLILWMRDPRARIAALFVIPALLAVRLLLQIWLPGGLPGLAPRRRAAAVPRVHSHE